MSDRREHQALSVHDTRTRLHEILPSEGEAESTMLAIQTEVEEVSSDKGSTECPLSSLDPIPLHVRFGDIITHAVREALR